MSAVKSPAIDSTTTGCATVAVVGAGWAGCAAAVELTLRGVTVHLLEASKNLGGRARRLRLQGVDEAPDAWETRLDNGQHILLGSYTESLRLMRAVGVSLSETLLRLPLQMRYPPKSGGMDFVSAKLPAPLHLAVALLRTPGLGRADKLCLLRFVSAARWMDWQLNSDCSVADLLATHRQTPRVIELLWRPLCLAALNTPLDNASAQVFLTVLRDSLGAKRSASDMLIPRVDLSSLFPGPAAVFIEKHGGRVVRGARVTAIKAAASNAAPANTANGTNCAYDGESAISGHGWQLMFDKNQPTRQNIEQSKTYAAVILATPSSETERLLRSGNHIHGNSVGNGDENSNGSATLHPMTHEPIVTCYLQYEASVRLERPFYALQDSPSQQRWGQFVFDRGHLDPHQAGLLAVVVSAAHAVAEIAQDGLCAAIARQLATDFHNPALCSPLRVKKICEKRATFSCTPGLKRPGTVTAMHGIVLAGDYVSAENKHDEHDEHDEQDERDQRHKVHERYERNYPATIEAAVRNGVRAAATLCPSIGKGVDLS